MRKGKCVHCNKLCFLCVIFVLTFSFIVNNLTKPLLYSYKHVNMSGLCVLPDLDPFDKEVMKHIFKPDPLICSDDINLVYFTFDGVLTMNKTAASSFPNLVCSYQEVKRAGDFNVEHGGAISLKDPVYIHADLCYITCKSGKNVIWERYLNNIDSKSVLSKKNILNESDQHLNVFVLGLDSTSKLAALRHLPKTINYFLNTLEANIFHGQTVIEENTFGNMIPFLTGKFANELDIKITEKFDKLHVIWNDFKRKGYVTYYAEDFLRYNIFNYYGQGFEHKPVDHYMRPFYLSLEKQDGVKSYLDLVKMKAEAMKIKLSSNSIFCYQNQARHNVMFENIKHFFHTYKGKRKFVFGYLSEITHEVPSFTSLVDEDIYRLFKWLKGNNHLNNTVIFFLGDHGPRIDSVRNTVVGRIEVIMPLLTIYIPGHIKTKYPNLMENLQSNTRTLSTHTDSYKTLVDIANQSYNYSRDVVFDSDSKGISFFRNINPKRTCSDIKISPRLCPCYTSKEINSSDPRVGIISNFVVSTINKDLGPYSKLCHAFKVENVEYAEEIESGLQKTRVQNFRLKQFFTVKETVCERLRILLRMNIKSALFEAMVDICPKGLKLIGRISRNNKYGNQSACLSNKNLKSFCVCI